MIVEHPLKINALVNPRCEIDNLSVLTKILSRRQHSGQQKRRVYGRDFALPTSLPGGGVQPMIKPPGLMLGAFGKKTQGQAYPFTGFFSLQPIALSGYAQRSKSETCTGNAG